MVHHHENRAWNAEIPTYRQVAIPLNFIGVAFSIHALMNESFILSKRSYERALPRLHPSLHAVKPQGRAVLPNNSGRPMLLIPGDHEKAEGLPREDLHQCRKRRKPCQVAQDLLWGSLLEQELDQMGPDVPVNHSHSMIL